MQAGRVGKRKEEISITKKFLPKGSSNVYQLAVTNPERHKSAPCLRLKHTKSVKIFSFTVPEKPKSLTELACQGDALRFFIHSVANHQKY